MITLVLYFLYILLLVFSGFVVINNLFRGKVNFFENVGIALAVGLISNFIIVAGLSTLHVGVSMPRILVIQLMIIGLIYVWDLKLKRSFLEFQVEKFEFNLVSLLIILLVGGIFFVMLYRVMSTGFTSWDEFSYWGKAARMTFVDRNIFINRVVTVEGSGQPVFWPASAGSMAIFGGKFVENYVKLLTLSIYTSFCVYLFGFMMRFKLNLNEKLLFVLLFVSSSQALLQYSTYLHADIPLMYFYSAGTILLFSTLYRNDSKDGLFWLGIILLSAVIFIKRGGSILSLISLFSLAAVSLRGIFKNQYWRKVVLASIVLVVLQLVWMVASPMLGEMASPFNISKPFEFFRYGLEHLSQMTYGIFSRFNNHYNFTAVWFLSFASIIWGVVITKGRVYFSIALLVFLNISYLMVAYLVMFSQMEMVTLASFERYILAFLPICFTAIIMFYSQMKELTQSAEIIR